VTDHPRDVPCTPSLGGVIHTYLGYDPVRFPPPAPPSGGAVGVAMEHMLMHGSMRQFSDEELANAIDIDPASIQGLGPSLESLRAMLLERKRRILETHETTAVRRDARQAFHGAAEGMQPPPELEKAFRRHVSEEQLRDLERLWYRLDERSLFARRLLQLIERLSDRYQVEQLASRHAFTGRTPLTIPEALALKEELETIDRLLEQIEQSMKDARVGRIDLDALADFAEQNQLDDLQRMARQIEELARQAAEREGLERGPEGWRVSPRAMRVYQQGLLRTIFENLQDARSGRHAGVESPDGAIELPTTRDWQFGDPASSLDLPQTFTNALLRQAGERGGGPRGTGPLRLTPADMQVHRTRKSPKAATAVIMDMSGSMRYGGLHAHCKRMALALDGLIRSEYPGDFLQFIEMYTLARPCPPGEVTGLLPKPVSVFSPVVRLKADMSDPRLGESSLPLHFTNIQRSLQLARQFLAAQPTPNRQVILITDGLPTAHFEGSTLFMLYPPHPRTEQATLREGERCRREGITINVILLPSWNQGEEDVGFARRLAERTGGRVAFVGGRELDRFVVWDYLKRRRTMLG
jgi:uncharacterized protein with von Willebrand factor type A (vWA) domain